MRFLDFRHTLPSVHFDERYTNGGDPVTKNTEDLME